MQTNQPVNDAEIPGVIASYCSKMHLYMKMQKQTKYERNKNVQSLTGEPVKGNPGFFMCGDYFSVSLRRKFMSRLKKGTKSL